MQAALGAVEEVASQDDKHGPRIRLENYIILHRAFGTVQDRQVRLESVMRGAVIYTGDSSSRMLRTEMRVVAELRHWLSNPKRQDIVMLTLPVLEPLQASQLQKIVKSLGEALYAAEASYIEQQVDYFGFAAVLALSRVRWGLLGGRADCLGVEGMH